MPAFAAGSRKPPERSRVVEVRSSKVVDGRTVHGPLLREMLHKALAGVTGERDEAAAWRRLLRPDDMVGLKFNRSAQDTIGTTPAFAEALVGSLTSSGWPASRIVCIELPGEIGGRLGTVPPAIGFEAEAVDFGSGADQLSLVLRQVTALISVPFLKTHNLAGITASLKNLSHGLVKHPARYHDDGCSPYIADIVALPQIRDKLRLCLVDGLRVVYADGPDPRGNTVADAGVVLASRDPVSIDAVGLATINDIRSCYNMAPITKPGAKLGYLAAAAGRGLGVGAAHGIDLVQSSP